MHYNILYILLLGGGFMTKDIISLINKKLKELEGNSIFLKKVSFGINSEKLNGIKR